jgi:hypothetical protein
MHKKEHIKENPRSDFENISKALTFDSPSKSEDDQIDRIMVSNPFDISMDNDIQVIEEVSNETMTTGNEDKELQKNDDSLFGWPQTTINKEGNQISTYFIENSFSLKDHNFNVKNTSHLQNVRSCVSFQIKDKSESHIKELFNTSPMISSPDFDKNNSCKLFDNNDEVLDEHNMDGLLDSVQFDLEKQSEISELSSVKKIKNWEQMDISPSDSFMKPTRTFCLDNVSCLTNTLRSKLLDHQNMLLKDAFSTIKTSKNPKSPYIKRLNTSCHALCLVFNSFEKKNLLHTFAALKTSNRKTIQSKTIQSKTSESSQEMSTFQAFLLLKNSVKFLYKNI